MRLGAVAVAACISARALQPDAARVSEQAVGMLREGRDDSAWSLLRQSADNSVRSFLIRDIPRLAVSADIVIRRLRSESDASARRALILTLGGYSREALSPADRQQVTALLLQWYETDPDPGIHSAIEWLLRSPGDGSARADWGQSSRLSERARAWRGQQRSPNRRWFVTSEGQTMAAFVGPSSVQMGSPADEPGRQPASDSPAEPTHLVVIPRSFALAATEVTVAEFRRFLEANPEAKRGHQYPGAPNRMAEVLSRFSPDDEGPAIAVTWYEAAMYCNWLSAREGLPRSEWAYPDGEGAIAEGMEMPSDYLHRTGYRLPTEAEWEFAVRAGTTTSRFFGSSEDLLPQYAWFSRNPPRTKDDPVDPGDPQRTSPVGRLKPNDSGLFDVYGNVWEWTQDRVQRHQSGDVREDREDGVLRVVDRDARARRGGAFPYEAAMGRSAARGTVNSLPTNRRDNVGFRVARTIR